MAQEKICPSCDRPNNPDRLTCMYCGWNIGAVTPQNKIDEIQNKFPINPDVIEKREDYSQNYQDLTVKEDVSLTLKSEDGETILVHHNDIIGRSGVGKAILTNQYISRNHAVILNIKGKWFIKDNNSTNGTFLNGNKIDPNKQYPLKIGDNISLSSYCSLRVQ